LIIYAFLPLVLSRRQPRFTPFPYTTLFRSHIWNEWAFERYIKSTDYHGPDMTDFGRRALADEAFNQLYQTEMATFCQRILEDETDRKSTRLNSSHVKISYAVFCLKKKKHNL